ncbi:hypothetical protein D3C80_1532730 [compost metagenome]
MADIADVAAFGHQPDVMANFFTNVIQQLRIGEAGVAFVIQQRQLHHFQQVEHGNVVQAVGAPWDRQLNTAHHRIITRIFQ